MQLLAGEPVDSVQGVTGCGVGDPVGNFHLTGGDVGGAQQHRQHGVGNVHEMQPAAIAGNCCNLQAGIGGDIGGVSRQIQLAQDNRIVELGGVHNCQSVRAGGHIGGLGAGVQG